MPETPSTDGSSPDDSGRLLVLLCTYNERQSLPLTIQGIRLAMPAADILVVDDASPDGTGEWVRERMRDDPKLCLIGRPGKLGLGSALLDGMRWALERDYNWLVNLDADLSHDPADIPRLVAAARDRSVDVAVASRYVPGGAIVGWPWHRRFISRWLNRVARWSLRLPLRDYSGSFRCYRIACLRRAPLDRLRARGYALLEEILVLLSRGGATFAEVPITFTDRRLGSSKLTLSEAWGTATTILRLGFTRQS